MQKKYTKNAEKFQDEIGRKYTLFGMFYFLINFLLIICHEI